MTTVEYLLAGKLIHAIKALREAASDGLYISLTCAKSVLDAAVAAEKAGKYEYPEWHHGNVQFKVKAL